MTRLRWLLFVGCLSVAALPARADPTIQTFTPNTGTAFVLQNFSGPGATIMPGGPSNEFLRLTYAGTGNTQNLIAFDRTQVGNVAAVSASFDFRIGGSTNFADGIAFELLNTANFGTTGTLTNFFTEEPFLAASFGLGLDTYNNGLGSLDPDNNHLSIHYTSPAGVLIGAAFPLSPFGYMLHQDALDDAATPFDHLSLTLASTTGGANVSVSITPAGGTAFTPINNFFLPGYTSYEMRAAFSGRTGGANDTHDIDNINIQYTPNPGPRLLVSTPNPEPTTLVLAGVGLLCLLHYAWRKQRVSHG